mmetsp:Transcript_32603/g.81729  ORF Transcript_32603/g.81729 Transcript_32603/m.81729 type:complete len:241 (+) Transcript_32603:3077-3799(+)
MPKDVVLLPIQARLERVVQREVAFPYQGNRDAADTHLLQKWHVGRQELRKGCVKVLVRVAWVPVQEELQHILVTRARVWQVQRPRRLETVSKFTAQLLFCFKNEKFSTPKMVLTRLHEVVARLAGRDSGGLSSPRVGQLELPLRAHGWRVLYLHTNDLVRAVRPSDVRFRRKLLHTEVGVVEEGHKYVKHGRALVNEGFDAIQAALGCTIDCKSQEVLHSHLSLVKGGQLVLNEQLAGLE